MFVSMLRRRVVRAWSYGWSGATEEIVAAAGFLLGGVGIVLLSYPFLQEHRGVLTAVQFVTLAMVIQAMISFGKVLRDAACRIFLLLRGGFHALLGSRSPTTLVNSDGVWGLRLYLLVTGLWISLLSLLGLLHSVESRQEDRLERVEGFEVGSDIVPLGMSVFFPAEEKFETWKKNCSVEDPERALSLGNRQKLRRLMQIYSQCGSDDVPVHVEVRGFASSSIGGGADNSAWSEGREECGAWAGCLERQQCEGSSTVGQTDCVPAAFNLCVAENRANHVRRWLEGQMADSGSVRFSVRPWKNYEEMSGQQAVLDRFDGVYEPDFGAINRRVEVVMVGGGFCQFVRLVTVETPPKEWVAKIGRRLDQDLGGEGRLWCRLRSVATAAAEGVRRLRESGVSEMVEGIVAGSGGGEET